MSEHLKPACLSFVFENNQDFLKHLADYIDNTVTQKVDEIFKHKHAVDTVDLISVSETLMLTSPPIGRTTLHLWVKKGKIKVFKVGKRSYFSKKAVLTFLTSVEKKPPKVY